MRRQGRAQKRARSAWRSARAWSSACRESGRRSFVNDARVAHVIVERALLIVKRREDVADVARQLAYDFRPVPCECARIADPLAVRRNDSNADQHLARCRAVASNQEPRVE